MKRQITALVICSLLAAPLQARPAPQPASIDRKIAELNDLANDWTSLSPRRDCLFYAGLRYYGNSISMEREVKLHQTELDPRTYQKTLDRRRAGYEASGRATRNFADLITVYGQGLGVVAIPELLDLRAIRKWTAELQAIPIPVPRPQYASQDFREFLDAETKRACMLEFFASAYGIGEADVEGRYAAVLELWSKEKSPLVSAGLVSLNYMSARSRLAKGDEAGAFALSNDWVMRAASKNSGGAVESGGPARWRASFHQYGIGTKVSLLDAARILDEGGVPEDSIQSALLKASAGQKDVAAAQLRHWMTAQYRSKDEMARAQQAYQAITGSHFQQEQASTDPFSNLLGGLFAVSLGILAYCLSENSNCPTANGGGASQGEDSLARLRRQEREQYQRMEALQDFSRAANGFRD